MMHSKTRMNVVALLFLVVQPMATAQWVNGQNADLVLGQASFESSAFGLAVDSLHAPTGIAIDQVSGKLFVADIANNRVLRWGSVTALVNGMAAEAVFGQPDFKSKSARATRNGMNFPTDVAISAEGKLFVADALNNRVLRFDGASAKLSGADADGVLGQPDFTSMANNLSRSGMNYVRGVAVDQAGRLWVSDQSNDRVLRFDSAATKSNGADADGVLGQTDFTSHRSDTSRNGMKVPRGLTLDAQGRLWVANSWNHRVVRFDNAAAKPNGADADGVLGQPDFTSALEATTASGMREPIGVAVDPSGRLYVVDERNHRVLWFNNAAGKPNGGAADGVLGQSDFTSASVAVKQNGMNYPWGVQVDRARNTIWVSDSENNRVLRFTATSPLGVDHARAEFPDVFLLLQNYPNPFNPSTTIRYGLPNRSQVTLTVFNTLGQQVAVLQNGEMEAGYHEAKFDATGLSSGVYFYRMQAGNFVETRKLLLMK
jgi:DNA-binding beta-propeller fold protein YncE